MRAQQILRTDGSSQPLGSTAWFEDAVAQPDQVCNGCYAGVRDIGS